MDDWNGHDDLYIVFVCVFIYSFVNLIFPVTNIDMMFIFPKILINDRGAFCEHPVWVMAWLRPGHNPVSKPMMVRLPTHICVARPQWVNKPFRQCAEYDCNAMLNSLQLWHKKPYVRVSSIHHSKIAGTALVHTSGNWLIGHFDDR